MARSILVTGGAGYIGSVVVEQLLALGRSVVVLDDLSRGHRAALDPAAEFVEGGIADRRLLDDLLARRPCDALVHLAAYALVAESVAHPQMYFTNNVAGGRVLLDAVLAAGVRRVIFSSSCAVYGYPPVIPIPEDAPRAPVNPYGETKLAFERLLGDYATRHGVASISLRYFNAAGATARHGEDHDPETHLIPNVLQAALGRRPAVEVFGTDYPTPGGTDDALGARAHLEPRDEVRARDPGRLLRGLLVPHFSEVVAVSENAQTGGPFHGGDRARGAARGRLPRRDATTVLTVQPAAA